MWKDPHFNTLLLNLIGHTFFTHSPPNIWHESQIVLMPRKSDNSLATNYRDISLTVTSAKWYYKHLLNRFILFVGPVLSKDQNGFRHGRYTLTSVLFLRRLIEESNLSKLELIIIRFLQWNMLHDVGLTWPAPFPPGNKHLPIRKCRHQADLRPYLHSIHY